MHTRDPPLCPTFEKGITIKQSCFRELNSIPASGGAEEPDLNNTGITSYPLVPVQLTYCSNGQIPNQTSTHSVPAGTQPHLVSFSEEAEVTNSARNLAMYVPLYNAAHKGDWEEAKEFFYLHPQAITARISNGWESALHIAAGAKQIIFVEELVKMMDPLDLELKNKYENTALCFAVASGITKIAELMVAKNSYLPMIRGINGVTALHIAALLGYRDMVWYLSSVADGQDLTKEDYVGLLIATISSDLYGVSAKLLNKTGRTSNFRLLNRAMHLTGIQGVIEKTLMQSQALELVKCLWKQVLFLSDDLEIKKLLRSPSRPFFIAAEFGNFQFIRELILSNPDLIWKVDEQSRSIFHFAEVEKNMQPLYKEMKDSEVPGGKNNNTGTPMFLKDKSFIIFSISNALALFSSVKCILMFLSIFTSRYAEEDFLESLPKRLIIGLTTLFFSIASMLLAFSARFFIVVGHQLAWIIIPIALTACVPVTLFASLQFPLLADVMHSTYGSGIFSMERNERLY
ncbi:ankyrin repeat-containing ITN1-like [Olea europaea subsp. europaea]|uniref:Ankyrin repeat-containing ITN1-like n=1 Tax=Olea europaea subsp. europaea TaxID=158383 RepID=A0A8S0P8A8_OLEEU|nr:ankyrin repeat-containing ITN1-like [Olea europaea subsp. europaea]